MVRVMNKIQHRRKDRVLIWKISFRQLCPKVDGVNVILFTNITKVWHFLWRFLFNEIPSTAQQHCVEIPYTEFYADPMIYV